MKKVEESTIIYGKNKKILKSGMDGLSTRHNLSVRSKGSAAGITLIALIVTIIVLLILARNKY